MATLPLSGLVEDLVPESLELKFGEELRQIEGETGMRYVTRFEQRALDRGREEGSHLGREEGIQTVLKRQLLRRFESLPPPAISVSPAISVRPR